MATMYRSASLENKDLMALYGGGGHCVFDEESANEEHDLDSKCGSQGKGARNGRSSLSLQIYGSQREQNIHFSNQEYYRRLEELKGAHLRNMAEMERMYISQSREGQAEDEDRGPRREEKRLSISSAPCRKLQRIDSQEELDFHETSSCSDQSDFYGADSMGELELDNSLGTGQDGTFESTLLSPEDMITDGQFRFPTKTSYRKPQGRMFRQTGPGIRTNSKITVPKPFQMMLREEERKKQKVRTRSEIELENTLLKRELEELQECQKKFRAAPAPAHIHLPLYEIISSRSSQGSSRSFSYNNDQGPKRQQATATASLQPFHFLERERRKREAKIVAELGRLGLKEERQTFKARPMPSSVYGTKLKVDTKTSSRQPHFATICTVERDPTEGQSDPNSDPEQDVLDAILDASPESCRPQRGPTPKPVKKQIELSIEMVKEREWSCTDPYQATVCSRV